MLSYGVQAWQHPILLAAIMLAAGIAVGWLVCRVGWRRFAKLQGDIWRRKNHSQATLTGTRNGKLLVTAVSATVAVTMA